MKKSYKNKIFYREAEQIASERWGITVEEAVKRLYLKTGSLRKVGYLFNVTSQTIKRWMPKDVKINGPGGAHVKDIQAQK